MRCKCCHVDIVVTSGLWVVHEDEVFCWIACRDYYLATKPKPVNKGRRESDVRLPNLSQADGHVRAFSSHQQTNVS